MVRVLAVVLVVCPLLCAGGCAWQANSGSQAVDINPLAMFSGDSVFNPASGPGYMDGQPMDMRTKH